MANPNVRLFAAVDLDDAPGLRAALADGAVLNPASTMHDTPLLYAAQGGRLVAFRALLEAGGDPTAVRHTRSVVRVALQGGHPQLIREAVKARESVSPSLPLPLLHTSAAATEGGLAVAALLSAAVDIGERAALVAVRCAEVDGGGTALHFAAACQNRGAVEALLAAGAPVDAADALGCTALHLAAQHGSAGVIAALLAGGAAADTRRCDGSSPRHLAALHCCPEAVTVLLSGGATVDARTSRGGTPLHIACERGRVSVVGVLLAVGADANTATARRCTTPPTTPTCPCWSLSSPAARL
jgi:ankyrin repeat protein